MSALLNPLAALLPSAAAAAAAAAAAIGNNPAGGSSAAASGAPSISIQSVGGNLLLNFHSSSFSNSLQSNASSITSSSTSLANYHTDKAEWINRIEASQPDQALMNKLVMNYLVTGNFKLYSFFPNF